VAAGQGEPTAAGSVPERVNGGLVHANAAPGNHPLSLMADDRPIELSVSSRVASVPFNSTRYRRRTIRQRLTAPAIAIGLVAYFGFHALNGELGLVGKARIEHRYAALEKELAELQAQREELLRRVVLLRPESLDPDMIDERARLSLNLVHPQELAILRPQGGRSN